MQEYHCGTDTQKIGIRRVMQRDKYPDNTNNNRTNAELR